MEQVENRLSLFLRNEEVLPGYLYDISSKTYHKRKDGTIFDTQNCPVSFSFEIMSSQFMRSYIKISTINPSKWQEDFSREDPVDAIRVEGIKCQEKKGINIKTDEAFHTVTSVVYKTGMISILIVLKQEVPKGTVNKITEYFRNVLNGANESFIPNEIIKHFKTSYIYKNYYDPGSKLDSLTHASQQFCLLLKDAKISTIPMRAIIVDPQPLTEMKSEDQTTEVPKPCVNTESHTRNTKIDKSPDSSQDDVARVHLIQETPKIPPHSTKTSPEEQEERLSSKPSTKLSEDERTSGKTKGHRPGAEKIPDETQGIISEYHEPANGNVSMETCKSVASRIGSTGIKSTVDVNCMKQDTDRQQINESVTSRVQEIIMQFETPPNHDEKMYKKDQITITVERDNEPLLISHNDDSRSKLPTPSFIPNTNILGEHQDSSIVNTPSFNTASYGLNKHKAQNVEDVENCTGSNKYRENSESNYNLINPLSTENVPEGTSINSQEKRLNKGNSKMNTQGEEEKSDGCDSLSKTAQTGDQHKPHDDQQETSESMLHVNSKKNSENDQKSVQKENKEHEPTAESNTRNKEHETTEEKSKESEKDTASQKYSKKEKKQISKQLTSKTINGKQKDADRLGSDNIHANQETDMHGQEGDYDKVDLKSTGNVRCQKQIESQNQHTMKTRPWPPELTENDPCGVERKYFGVVNKNIPEKVILLLGAKGSGKTTMVNFVANYFCGNKAADDNLIHVEVNMQTSTITAYTFCMKDDDVPITVIDTPGLNDSSGGEVRDHVLSLKTFLANTCSNKLEIHAIGFVAQAHLVRLTSSERLVMDYVSTLFGQSVSEHLITLVTFADIQDSPPIVEAMNTYKIKVKQFLKFNNSILSNGISDEEVDVGHVYYRVCWRNWKKCLKTLKDMPALSVNAMKAIQSEVYATTVTESAEKDLQADLRTFFMSYQKSQKYAFFSKENMLLCEQIWEQAAVVHRLRSAQKLTTGSTERILIEFSKSVCQVSHLPPSNCIPILTLAPSKGLTVAGTSIISTMKPLYTFAQKNYPNAKVSKNIAERSYCLNCKEEHKMKRCEEKGFVSKYIPGFGHSADILALKCENCQCPGGVHAVSKVEAPLHSKRVLTFTLERLQTALTNYSIPGYTIEPEFFLNFLKNYLSSPYENFMGDCLKMLQEVKSNLQRNEVLSKD